MNVGLLYIRLVKSVIGERVGLPTRSQRFNALESGAAHHVLLRCGMASPSRTSITQTLGSRSSALNLAAKGASTHRLTN